jgi:hypothetical protein
MNATCMTAHAGQDSFTDRVAALLSSRDGVEPLGPWLSNERWADSVSRGPAVRASGGADSLQG